MAATLAYRKLRDFSSQTSSSESMGLGQLLEYRPVVQPAFSLHPLDEV